MRVSHQSLRRLSNALLELQAVRSLQELPNACLRAAQELLSADVYTADSFNLKTLQARSKTWPDNIPGADIAILNAHLHEHPSLEIIQRPELEPVVMWTDFTTLRQFRNTALFQEFYMTSGTTRQLALAFKADEDTTFCAVFNRCRKDFTEDDRAVLQLLVPHLKAAYNHAVSCNRAADAMRLSEIATDAQAVVIVTEQGDVLRETAPAVDLCREYFRKSPRTVATWLLTRCLSPHECSPGVCVEDRGVKRLITRCSGPFAIQLGTSDPLAAGTSKNAYVLRMREKRSAPRLEAMRQLGLTAKEAEIVSWMAQGKRNPEISTILEVKGRTVDKHVENIIAKLHVETRGAAVAKVWDADSEFF